MITFDETYNPPMRFGLSNAGVVVFKIMGLSL